MRFDAGCNICLSHVDQAPLPRPTTGRVAIIGPEMGKRNRPDKSGHCIYCGRHADRLGDEHVVPFAFGASGGVFPAASCVKCSGITRDFEQLMARTIYGRLRVRTKMPTRRPDERPATFPLRVRSAAGEREVHIPARDYPRLYPVFVMPPPGILEGRAPSDTSPEGLRVDLKGHPEDVGALYAKGYLVEGVDDVWLDWQLLWNPFNRFLAKIAHAHAVRELGREGYKPFLPPLILGESAEFSHYIGGFQDKSPVRHVLQLELHPVGAQHFITCKIWLIMRDLGPDAFPIYHVVVGHTDNPQTWIDRARTYQTG